MTIYEFHTAIDDYLAKCLGALPAHEQPCCSRCTSPHCCSEPAYSDETEVLLMLVNLTPEQREYVRERTLQWRAVFSTADIEGEEEVSAFKYRLLNLPCPFLRDGRCLNYEHRPMACREFFALGNPDDCAMPARIHQKYAAYPHPNGIDAAMLKYYAAIGLNGGTIELDHIGAHLVRHLLYEKDFTTAAHQRVVFKED